MNANRILFKKNRLLTFNFNGDGNIGGRLTIPLEILSALEINRENSLDKNIKLELINKVDPMSRTF